MKRLVKNIMMLAVVAIAAVACHKDDFVTDIPQIESDMMHLRFGVVSPDMRQVSTRAVDPDGKGIQNITLFCFDDEGLFIEADLGGTEIGRELYGKFEAVTRTE